MKKENIFFILDRSQMVNNIAQAARAMANFGFRHLRLVAPLNLSAADTAGAAPESGMGIRHGGAAAHGFLAAAARMARGGAEVVERAEIFQDLPSALADLTWVLGTTGKDKAGTEELLRPEEACAELAGLSEQGRVGLVFGCENHGLTMEQLRRMDRLAHVPTDPSCASINLAQSVALFSWELERLALGPPRPLTFGLPTYQKRAQLFLKLERLLSALDVRPEGRKSAMVDGLRQFFNRQPLNNKDVSMLLRALNLLLKRLGA